MASTKANQVDELRRAIAALDATRQKRTSALSPPAPIDELAGPLDALTEWRESFKRNPARKKPTPQKK